MSQGCAHCYAERESKRYGMGSLWGPAGARRRTSDAYWRQPRIWNRAAQDWPTRMRVFCGSMCDIFEERLDLDEVRADLWRLIEATPNLDWLLLTKRLEVASVMVPWRDHWPANVWLGVSAEDQATADRRIPQLARLPAAVRFLSLEPLLGPISLRAYLREATGEFRTREGVCQYASRPADAIHWVIVGGESGPGCRPMDWDWVRAIRDECVAAGVPLFVKQRGGWPNKGTELAHLPEDLRLRVFPQREDA